MSFIQLINVYSLRRLKEYYAPVSIYLVVRESREKLFYHIDEELQESVKAHWMEGRDKFHYGRFAMALW